MPAALSELQRQFNVRGGQVASDQGIQLLDRLLDVLLTRGRHRRQFEIAVALAGERDEVFGGVHSEINEKLGIRFDGIDFAIELERERRAGMASLNL